jgi:S1-C subfamily serine protease
VRKTVVAEVLRDGKEMTISVTTAERRKAQERQHELKPWGICASNITYLMQKEMERDSQDGVVITGVLPSGPGGSAKPPLSEDDVIVKVNGEVVKDIAGLRTITYELTEGGNEPVPVLVNFDRKQMHLATVVKVGEKEQARPGTEISKAWLPIGLQVLTRDLAEALGATGKTGVRVTQVYAGASAEKAGLQVSDLIVTLDGERIPADQVGDEEVLPSLIRQYDIGAQVKLGIIRDGAPMEVAVTLDTSPKLPRDYRRHTEEQFGFTVRDIAFADRTKGGVKHDQSGAYVESVVEGSWAALGQLCASDVITQIDGENVGNLDDLKSAVQAVARKKPRTVVFKVQRGIHTLFVEIEPDWSESDS